MKHILLAFCLCPLISSAQDTNVLSTFTISDDRISTSVLGSGRNVQVITNAQIESLAIQTVQELFQYISGVDLRQRGPWGAQADVSTRGGTFDQTLILVNGIKMNDPQTGHHSLNLGIDLGNIERVEVIKGPAASRYGINSFNGVINIITSPGEDNSVKFGADVVRMANSSLPDAHWAGYQFSGAAGFGSKASRHMLSAQSVESSGYRANTDLSRQAVSYVSTTVTSLGELKAMGSILQNRFGASGFYAFPIDSSSEESIRTFNGALIYSHSVRKINFKAKLYSRQNGDVYTLFRNSPEIYQNVHRTNTNGAEAHASLPWRLGTSGVGVEFRSEKISSTNLGERIRDITGVFAEHRLSLFKDRLFIQAGTYVNYLKKLGVRFLPSASLVYQPNAVWSVFGNIGQSLRIPTFTDLYYEGPTNVGNADLNPEQNVQFEVGTKIESNGNQFQTSAFHQRSSGMIDWTRTSEDLPWVPMNLVSLQTEGIEVNYTMSRPFSVVDHFLQIDMLRVGYTYLNLVQGMDDSVLSRYALSQLRNQVVAQLSFTINTHWSITPAFRYSDRVAYKDYSLFDLRLHYKQPNYKLWLDGVNLFNTAYSDFLNAPLPGRWFRLGFEVDIR